ncbi:hypothetical protein M9H77_04995 [Catharanthus roseus]|uniref:Uncharacterized protein n=1 Tax=Catharanthus roseus TaxID=4058 RepID=A0ACC0CFM5_CATRO|nr:hypothetical protein M9H77_04995 [Catharanthus roseus]
MLCGSGYFLAGWVKRGPPARTQGGLAGIDYEMPEFVPMTSFKDPDFVHFPTASKPFREFITCIQAIFMKLLLFWHVKPFYKKYFTHVENLRKTPVHVNSLGVHRSCLSNVFSIFSDDLVTRSG